MKDKMLKWYRGLFCVILAVFMAIVAVYIVIPMNMGTSDNKTPSTDCKIVLSQGEKYEAKSYVSTVKKGTDATFELTFEDGYAFDGCDYENYELLSGEKSSFLMLKDVCYPMNVEVYMKELSPSVNENLDPEGIVVPNNSAGIIYYLNGGTMISQSETTYYSVVYKLGDYQRANTDKAIERIEREGYVLKGWNTEADGSGTSVGLGSRHTVVRGLWVKLYAQWSKCAAESDFEYALVDSSEVDHLYSNAVVPKTLEELITESNSDDRVAIITKYNGTDKSELTFPETLNGYPVGGIMENAVYQHQEITTVVLNSKIIFTQERAFNECKNLKEIYLFDNIERLGNYEPFGLESNVEKMYINALEVPVYSKNEVAQFANKMEMLINASARKPKMVFFGGCSLLYGLNASTVYTSFQSQYSVFNMGVIGGTCATFQMDLIYEYLNAKDIFIHAPELGSLYQLLGDVRFDNRVYQNLESNYDLLSLLNLKKYDYVFKAFNDYLKIKQRNLDAEGFDASAHNYVDRIDDINKYGDLIRRREGGYDNEGVPFIYETVTNFQNSTAVSVMQEYYGKFSDKGITLYYMFGAVNEDGLVEDAGEDLVKEVLNTLEQYDIPITALMQNAGDVKFSSDYFYDQNYHLSTDGAIKYTDIVLECLKEDLNRA